MTDDLGQVPGDLPATSHPVALLPVHLETCFLPDGDDVQLLVRIYPSDVHVDSHEPELTAQEDRWGRHFWEHVWASGTGSAEAERREIRAWEQLTRRFGTGRAAWVAHALEPRNLDARPVEPPAEGERLDPEPDFPEPQSRAEAWTRAARARLLPARWVVTGYRDGERVLLAWGRPIPSDLPVGPDPQATPPAEDEGATHAPVDEGMRWLVDVDEAERVGMAVRVSLDKDEAEQGFDILVAFGVDGSRDPEVVAEKLADLLDAQHHTAGLAFVPQGTATNNTSGSAAGYRSSEPDPVTSWQVERHRPAFEPADGSNGALVAATLGVRLGALAHVDHAGDREQDHVRHLHTALWPATWGYYLEQLLDTVSPDAAGRIRRAFIDRVRARGPLPALRVGRQPYGLLPVTALDRWSMRADDGDTELVGLMRSLRGRWRDALPHVPRLTESANGDDGEGAAARLVRVLGMTPTSRRYAIRPVLDLEHAETLLGTDDPHGIGRGLASARGGVPQALDLSDSDGDEATLPRIAHTALARNTVDLSAPLARPTASHAKEPPEPNYLEWLATADSTSLRDETSPVEEDTLLYLLLRHSVLVAYASTALRIQQAEGVAESGDGTDVAFVNIDTDANESARTMTLGRCLDRPVPAFGDGPIGERIHELGAEHHPEAAELDELRESLAALAGAPAAELEAALPETLDACAHRLDAWITALASERLDQLRARHASGVHIGGYGWVENLRPSPPRTHVDPPDGEPDTPPVAVSEGNAGYVHAPSLNQAATAAILRSGYRSTLGGDSAPFAVDLSSERVRLARALVEGIRGGQSLAALLGERFEAGLHERGEGGLVEAFRVLAPMSELYQLRRKLSDHDEVVEARERDVADAEVAVEDAQRERQRARDKVAELEQRRDTIGSDIDEAGSRLADREQEYEDAQDARDRARDEYNRRCLDHPTVDPCPDLLIKAKRKQQELSEAGKRRDAAQRRLDDLRSEQADLPGRVREAEDAVDDATQAISDRRQDLHDALDALRDARRQRGTVRAEYRRRLNERRRRYLYPPSHEVEPMASVAVKDVVDGLTLLRKHEAGEIPWGRDFGGYAILPRRGTDAAEQAIAELDRLARTMGAVTDLYLAEGIHQTVLADPERAAAALDVAGRGDGPPPEAEVIRTPRSGTEAAHRVLVLLDAEDTRAPGWPDPAASAYAMAAPQFDAWAGRQLGDPAVAACRCEYRDPDTPETLATTEFTLADLGLSPLEVVYGGQDRGAASAELKDRFADHALRHRPDGVRPGAEVRVHAGREEAAALAELLEVARAVAGVLDVAEPADGRAVAAPDDDVEPALDLDELARRAEAVVQRLRHAYDAARDVLSDAGAGAELLRAALRDLAAASVSQAVPRSARNEDEAHTLREQCGAAAREAARRLEAADESASDEPSGAAPEAVWEHHRARLRALLGRDIPVPARFRAADPETLAATFSASDTLQDGDPTAVVTWLQRAARVRGDLTEFALLLLYAEARETAELTLRVGQLPHADDDRWVALPPPDGAAIPGGRRSLVFHGVPGLDVTGPLAGLVVDEWSELVPRTTETTGVAFNFDDPAPRAPQAILLAVPPDERAHWDLETLEETVLDTLELAKLRAVDPDALTRVPDVGLFLPALYLAMNPRGDTVSTDFARVAQSS